MEALGATVEDLQVHFSSLRSGVEERLEAAAIHDKAASMMVFGPSKHVAEEEEEESHYVHTASKGL